MCLNLRSPSRLQLQVLVALRMPVEHTVGLPDPSGSSVTMETCAASSVAASAALAGSCLSSLAVLQTGPLLHQQRHQRQHGSGLRCPMAPRAFCRLGPSRGRRLSFCCLSRSTFSLALFQLHIAKSAKAHGLLWLLLRFFKLGCLSFTCT